MGGVQPPPPAPLLLTPVLQKPLGQDLELKELTYDINNSGVAACCLYKMSYLWMGMHAAWDITIIIKYTSDMTKLVDCLHNHLHQKAMQKEEYRHEVNSGVLLWIN